MAMAHIHMKAVIGMSACTTVAACMDGAHLPGPMATNMKAAGTVITPAVKAVISMQMAMSMWANGVMTKRTGAENLPGRTAQNISACGKMTKKMAKAQTIISMAVFMLGSGKTIKSTAKARKPGKMEKSIKVGGITACKNIGRIGIGGLFVMSNEEIDLTAKLYLVKI